MTATTMAIRFSAASDLSSTGQKGLLAMGLAQSVRCPGGAAGP